MKEAVYCVPVDRHPPYPAAGPVPSVLHRRQPLSTAKQRRALPKEQAHNHATIGRKAGLPPETTNVPKMVAKEPQSAETRVAMMKRLWRRSQ